jgi:hypothetical protein
MLMEKWKVKIMMMNTSQNEIFPQGNNKYYNIEILIIKEFSF